MLRTLTRTAHGAVLAHPLARGAAVAGLLFVFLVGVHGLGIGFRGLGEDALQSFFRATESPFTGLMLGILATTVVQSSSVTTSMIVGLVAAPESPLPLANAVPMIMGANVGTTVTNTLASLAHLGRPEEFERSFAVATVHDFFNYLAVLVLLPLELATGLLRRTAMTLAGSVAGIGGVEYRSPVRDAIGAAAEPIEAAVAWLFGSGVVGSLAYALLSGALIFGTLYGVVRVLRSSMGTRVEVLVESALGRSAVVAIGVGLLATALVQSSSITTSLMVPLAGAGALSLVRAFAVTVGANIGTTVTALLAALAATNDAAAAGLVIALVHVLFNVGGAGLIYGIAPLRRIPMVLAEGLARVAARSRGWAIAYVVGFFYAVPLAVALVNRLLT